MRGRCEGHMEPRWGSRGFVSCTPGGGFAATGDYQQGTPMGFGGPDEAGPSRRGARGGQGREEGGRDTGTRGPWDEESCQGKAAELFNFSTFQLWNALRGAGGWATHPVEKVKG